MAAFQVKKTGILFRWLIINNTPPKLYFQGTPPLIQANNDYPINNITRELINRLTRTFSQPTFICQNEEVYNIHKAKKLQFF